MDKIVLCEKCGAMVKVLIDCTCENCGIKCCGEVMTALVPNSVECAIEKHIPTYERVEDISIMVIKKDGSRQVFDRKKIMNGIIRACEKRPVTVEEMEKAANSIELKIHNKMKKEITSFEIGELVMDELKNTDEIAYVRFASVYRQFKDIESFKKLIDEL